MPVTAPAGRALPRLALPAATLALLVLHVLFLEDRRGLLLYEDGAGYLANARWLAGDGDLPWLGPTGFYHPGWSILLAPLFLVLDDGVDVIRGALLLNAVLATALVVPLYALGRRLAGLAPVPALGAAAVAALYPAALLQPTLEWSESLFPLVFAAHVLAAGRLLARPGAGAAAVTGATAAYLYAVHPRALPVVAVAAALVAGLALARRLGPPAAAAGLGVLAAGFAAVRLLNAALLDAMWGPRDPDLHADVVDRLLDPGMWWPTVERLAGQGWYLAVASLGLVPVAVVVLARRAARRPADAPSLWAAYVVAAAAGMALGSALQLAEPGRVDHLVYGRYNEGFVPVLLVAGMGAVLGARRRAVLVGAAGAAGAIVVLGAVTLAVNGSDAFAGDSSPANVLGILALDRVPHRLPVARITAAVLVPVAVVAAAAWWRRPLALAAVAVAFLAATVDVQDRHLQPWMAYWESATNLPHAVDRLEAVPGGGDGPVAYDLAGYDQLALNAYQVELLDRGVQRFHSHAGTPPRPLVVSTRSWSRAADLDARLVFPELSRDQALWVLPGALHDRLADAGFLLPAGPGDPTAADSAAAVAVAGDGDGARTMAAGGSDRVRVRLEHGGGGAPWLRGSVPVDGPTVLVTARWRPAAGGGEVADSWVDIPDTMVPGDTATVRLPLVAAGPDGRPLPAGDYEVVVRLEAGGEPFGDQVVLPVVVRST